MGSASRRIQHSKYKNPGILFELLVRQVTVDTLQGKDNSPAVRMLRDYFKPTTELGKELVLYRTLVEQTNLSENKANKVLDLVVSQRKKIDSKKLNRQKYELVKEIKEQYPLKDFLSSRIPQYKVYASIYKTLISESRPEKIDICDISDVANARFTIVEHMSADGEVTPKQHKLVESFKSQQEDLRLLTYKILVDRFNEKYRDLDKKQKTLLREFINNVSNTNSLREYVNSEVPIIKKELKSRLLRIDDAVTKIKLKEAISSLDSVMKGKVVKENQISALMVAYELVKEIDRVLE